MTLADALPCPTCGAAAEEGVGMVPTVYCSKACREDETPVKHGWTTDGAVRAWNDYVNEQKEMNDG